jgi:hypothetical protein
MRPTVNVTVALSTLLGLDAQPGELDGYGPIPAEPALRMAGEQGATWPSESAPSPSRRDSSAANLDRARFVPEETDTENAHSCRGRDRALASTVHVVDEQEALDTGSIDCGDLLPSDAVRSPRVLNRQSIGAQYQPIAERVA